MIGVPSRRELASEAAAVELYRSAASHPLTFPVVRGEFERMAAHPDGCDCGQRCDQARLGAALPAVWWLIRISDRQLNRKV